jgi:hypothetical protein
MQNATRTWHLQSRQAEARRQVAAEHGAGENAGCSPNGRIHLGYQGSVRRAKLAPAADVLFGLAAAATFTISSRGPWFSWAYTLCIFAFASVILLHRSGTLPLLAFSPLLSGAICLWGWLQYAFYWTVYRHATLVASLHWTAGFATMIAAACIFSGGLFLKQAAQRDRFLRAFAWLGFAVGVLGVLTDLTSPGAIFWIFPSPYPDTWGPFLSRNDFAMFLELSLPVALWGAPGPSFSQPVPEPAPIPLSRSIPPWVPASMLAAGLASASRAGAALLVMETAFCLSWRGTSPGQNNYGHRSFRGLPQWLRGPRFQFLIFTAFAISVAGFSPLRERLKEPNPFEFRKEIAASTVAMIRDRPTAGFGLGTFPAVYPAYASFDAGAVVEHAHNDWLEWSAEGGIPFALLWGMLAFTLSFPAVRSRWGVGLVAIFLHGLVDYPFAKIGLTAWIFTLAGILQAEGERTSSPNALPEETREEKETLR